MNSTKAMAHRIGALYFIFMILGIVGEFLFPRFMVPGDAAATARNITAGEPTYRLGILLGIATLVIFIFLVAGLYRLLRDASRFHSMLMVLLVSTGIALAFTNLLLEFVPLMLLAGTDYMSVFTKPQLDALALGALKLHGDCAGVVTAFWGLWLLPFGILVIKSRFFPRILGVLLMIAGLAYMVSSVTGVLFPEHKRMIFRLLMPLYLGEVPIIFWMMIMGAKARQAVTPPAPAG
ncbi:MAG: DUF4386 domain-containing protein [Candidatus Eisenbacteria bacterium]|nr:DUF4386 domain-containing protein [Candidatus Eisenbacteria bacterium]